MKSSVLFAATAAVGLALAASQASAATFLLIDTGAGLHHTDILNTTGELTGGDSAVKAGAATRVKTPTPHVVAETPKAFTDTAVFVIKPNELLASYDITNLPTSTIGAITGGAAEIYKAPGMTLTAIPVSLIDITTSTGAAFTDFSNEFKLGPGNYEVVVNSASQDFLTTQKNAKFSLELQGTAVPEPATWAVMLRVSGRSARPCAPGAIRASPPKLPSS